MKLNKNKKKNIKNQGVHWFFCSKSWLFWSNLVKILTFNRKNYYVQKKIVLIWFHIQKLFLRLKTKNYPNIQTFPLVQIGKNLVFIDWEIYLKNPLRLEKIFNSLVSIGLKIYLNHTPWLEKIKNLLVHSFLWGVIPPAFFHPPQLCPMSIPPKNQGPVK